MFIIELVTRSGRVCESYATYPEAKQRVDQFPAESLIGIPFIFQDLPDGSQRLVCEDGKPLQWHRLPWDEPDYPDEGPLPLSDASPGDAGESPL